MFYVTMRKTTVPDNIFELEKRSQKERLIE